LALLCEDVPGMKRARSGSTTSLVLPELASTFYAACATGKPAAVLKLCTVELAAKSRAAMEALAKALPLVGQMHPSPRTGTVSVEVGAALHLLRFDEGGLLESFRSFTQN
jgi:hypothetical protein